MKSGLVVGAALLAAAASAACSESPLTPVSPTESPFVTQFNGVWSGSMVLARVSGGECVGADLTRTLANGPGVDLGTVAITQDGPDVTAVVRSASTGLTCRYRGTASLGTFALSSESCDAEIVVQCANGDTRVLEPIGSTMTVGQDGNTTSGVVTTSYNVFSDSTEENQRRPVAGLTTQHQFTASRR